MKSIWYGVKDCSCKFEVFVPDNTDITRPIEQSDILPKCAEDFFWNHDGLEYNWPLEFSLSETKNGKEICRKEVHIEYEPSFFTYD